MQPVSSDVSSTFSASRQDVKIHIRKSVHDAFDAIFHQVASEVKDKAESQPFELQIGEQLLRVHLTELLDRLEFENHLAVDNHISPETLFEAQTSIYNGQSR